MATEKKPRPPIPPKSVNKERSFSDTSDFDKSYNNIVTETRNYRTLENSSPRKNNTDNVDDYARAIEAIPQRKSLPLLEESRTLPRQALPPDDCTTTLNLPSIEPHTLFEDETPVFYVSSSLPSNSSTRGESSSFSDSSDCAFQYYRQVSDDIRSKSIPDHLEGTGHRKMSDENLSLSTVVPDVFPEYFENNSSASLQSIRIEPSPERTLCPPGPKEFGSDPNLMEISKPLSPRRSDPEELESSKSIKGRGLRRSIQSMSKSVSNLENLDSSKNKPAKRTSPKTEKVDIKKLNNFFGESKETATDLEINFYLRLMSGNQLKEPSPEREREIPRCKKSASTWYLPQKALDSLPATMPDSQVQLKSRKTIVDRDKASAQKLKDGFSDKSNKIMKTLKRHVIGVAALADGISPAEEAQATFGVPLEKCVMCSTNRYVPLVVDKCVKVIEELGLYMEGVYRLSGNSTSITELQEELDKDPWTINHESERWNEVHVVSNLLKLFFRKLPDSLVTDELYDSLIAASHIVNREKRLVKLKVLLEKFPKLNFETFKFISCHLSRVASNQELNKMDAHNLAIMFGPSLIRSPNNQTVTMLRDMNDQTAIVETVIKHCDWLFGGWSKERTVPLDAISEDSATSASSNLQLLANAETLVARQLRVLPAEEESPSFFQGALRHSKRKHRNKSAKDTVDAVTEQPAVQDAERVIELRRVKIPTLPFKPVNCPISDVDPAFKFTPLDNRMKVKRSATERLDAKTLDIHLLSSRHVAVEQEPKENAGSELLKSDSGRATGCDSEKVEIKKYRAYNHDINLMTSSSFSSGQATLLKKYRSTELFQRGAEKENRRPEQLPLSKSGTATYKQGNVGYHPDVSQLPGYAENHDIGDSISSNYWENGSLPKKTNIVVRGPSGRRYCVLSATDPSVFLNRSSHSGSRIRAERRRVQGPKRCSAVGVKADVVRGIGAGDIELRRVHYL